MVVMAIIAILATAGLSAYTGYIKKARDAVRIADLNAINTIVFASMTTNGLPPSAVDTDSDGIPEIVELIRAANNGQNIVDPLTKGPYDFKSVCYTTEDNDYIAPCQYYYTTCPQGGYMIQAWFESPSNIDRYLEDASGPYDSYNIAQSYDIGSCQVDQYLTGSSTIILDNQT